MITAGDFRNGVTFEMDGNVVSIIEFQHVKPGKGAALCAPKPGNVITGAVTERTFNPTINIPPPISREKIRSIPTATAISIISWTTRPMEQTPINSSVLGDNLCL